MPAAADRNFSLRWIPMFLKMEQTPRIMIGRLLIDETYRFDPNKPKQKEVAASFIKRSMAEQRNEIRTKQD